MSLTDSVKVIRKRELRTKKKRKLEAKNEKNKLKQLEVKAAKDLDKANPAENIPDLIIPEPKFMVGSLVKSIVKTLPGTYSNESELVEGNVIYK